MRRTRPTKVYSPNERDRRGVILYAEVPPDMKRTLRKLAYEWEISQADIVMAALEQYLASQAIVMEKE